jgi:hypothetical protein
VSEIVLNNDISDINSPTSVSEESCLTTPDCRIAFWFEANTIRVPDIEETQTVNNSMRSADVLDSRLDQSVFLLSAQLARLKLI